MKQLAGLSANEAKEMVLQKVSDETRLETARIIRQIEEETHTQADKKAKEIISTAVGRSADYVAERTVSVVNLAKAMSPRCPRPGGGEYSSHRSCYGHRPHN